jgi:hypothetical protein
MISRRSILAVTPLAALAACAGQSADQTIATVAADANTIAGGLQGVLAQLGPLNVPGLTPSVISTVGVAVSQIQTVAASISGVTSAAAAQPLVQKIETYLNTIVAALAGLPLPPPVSTALQAAAILLPIIEVAVGLVVQQAAKAAPGAISPDEARMILRGSAATLARP